MGNNQSEYKADVIEGPLHREDRVCRDVLFCLLFVLFVLAFIGISVLAFMNGDPRSLFFPEDSAGNVCGTMNPKTNLDLINNKYLYRPNILQPKFSLCVSKCPGAGSVDDVSCDEKDLVCNYGVQPATSKRRPFTTSPTCFCPYKTKSYFYRCAPRDQSSGNATALKQEMSKSYESQRVSMYLGDVANNWMWMLCGVGAALVLCFIWLVILAYAARFMVWATLILFLLMLGGLTAASYWQWTTQSAELQAASSSSDDDNKYATGFVQALEVLFYVMCGLFGLAVLVVIWLARRISTASVIIQEAAEAVRVVRGVFMLPVVMFFVQLGFFTYWCATALFLGSIPDDTTNEYLQGNYLLYLRLAVLFGLFWILAFTQAIGHMTIGGSVATWYWATATEKEHLEGNSDETPVRDAFSNVVRFHMGSAALGSFILAIVQFLRSLVWMLEKDLQTNPDQMALLRYCLTCIKCCLDCIIRFLKFFSKNAYIYISITGDNFCRASYESFKLIVGRLLDVAIVNMVGPFLMFLGKFFVAGAAGVTTYALLRFMPNVEVNYYAIPVAIVMLLGFGVATIFFTIFEIGIDTILLSVLIDRSQETTEHHYRDELRELIED